MSICPSEHMHFLLQALKDKDRAGFSIYLAELLLWLQVPSNPMPSIRMVVVTAGAMGTAEETLRERAQGLRAMMGVDPSLSRQLESDASEHEQVADALLSLTNDTDFIVVQP
jgi:hypothetical protein